MIWRKLLEIAQKFKRKYIKNMANRKSGQYIANLIEVGFRKIKTAQKQKDPRNPRPSILFLSIT